MSYWNSVWVVEEIDFEDGPHDDWFPMEMSTTKREALEWATGRRQYLRQVKAKKCRVRVVEYSRKLAEGLEE